MDINGLSWGRGMQLIPPFSTLNLGFLRGISLERIINILRSSYIVQENISVLRVSFSTDRHTERQLVTFIDDHFKNIIPEFLIGRLWLLLRNEVHITSYLVPHLKIGS